MLWATFTEEIPNGKLPVLFSVVTDIERPPSPPPLFKISGSAPENGFIDMFVGVLDTPLYFTPN